MGTNSSKYDMDAEYSKKTIKALVSIRDQFEDAVRKHPDVKMFNEHLQYVKMCIANRIGK
jgi:hypothetical protein